jgi:hypothetical protein
LPNLANSYLAIIAPTLHDIAGGNQPIRFDLLTFQSVIKTEENLHENSVIAHDETLAA